MNPGHISGMALTLALLCGCSATAPSKDKNVNSNVNVSNRSAPAPETAAESLAPRDKASKPGFMQRAYERWEKEDWEPNTTPETRDEAAQERSVSKQESVQEEVPPGDEKQVQKTTPSSETLPVRHDDRLPAAEAGQASENVQAPDDRPDHAESAAQRERNDSDPATLQHYFDKWGDYLEAKEKQSSGPSQAEKMEGMPAIGVPDKE